MLLNKRTGVYFLVLLVLCTQQFYGQSKAAAELKKVSQAYLTMENLSMDVVVKSYKSKEDKTGTLMGEGSIKKSGKNYYSKFLKTEMLINSKATLVIDNDQKSIVYFEPDNMVIKNNEQIPDVDSILAATDSVFYKGVEGAFKHFCFYDYQNPIKQTDLYVDKTSSLLKRIVYFYKENTKEENYDAYKVVIEYENIQQEKIPESFFSEKKYIVLEKDYLKAAPAYKAYKVIHSENE
jgi:hypothetical protein